MKLGEFIRKFSHNNLIRLHYKIEGGHEIVGTDWNDVSMDWEVNKQKGNFRHFVNNEVIELVGIYFTGKGSSYPEAINICIEKLENQPLIEEEVEVEHNKCQHENM